ncbi:damage-inducible protein DinB [Salinicola endophyticus]|uniref:Damage-inducible protein DinB n=1 Tax=Salinicola endophyticus TaxID=1949083 RepID=A0ABY8FGM5_9GAMM|nr:DinB family protein [Salinicola endophyticus]WFF40326.1 damage-inducible protein DinB [Salinicola endophyticus]
MIEHFRHQAYCSLWSNHRLLTACAGLSQEALYAERSGFFPSIHATLNHILIVDAYYIDALEGGTLGLGAFDDELPHTAIDTLQPAQERLDRRLVALCESATPAWLTRETVLPRGTHQQHEPTHRVLAHLFVHQTHHRGQVHAMLSSTEVAPPQLDEFFLRDEAPLRQAEFSDLGIDEDQVWRSNDSAH